MSHPITNESNEPVLPTVAHTEEPHAVAVSDSTGAAPSKIGTSLIVLARLGLVYGLIVVAAWIIVDSPGYIGRGLAIYWIVATFSTWVVLLLGMLSAQSRGTRPYVDFLRYVTLGLYGIHMWVGKQKLKLELRDSVSPSSLDDDILFRLASLIVLIFFGYAINRLYVKATDLKHPDKLGSLDEGSVISDLPRLPREQPPEAYEMSGNPSQNSGNLQTWFSHKARWNQPPLASNLSLSDSREKHLPDNCDAV